jgi:hypothetical protein
VGTIQVPATFPAPADYGLPATAMGRKTIPTRAGTRTRSLAVVRRVHAGWTRANGEYSYLELVEAKKMRKTIGEMMFGLASLVVNGPALAPTYPG